MPYASEPTSPSGSHDTVPLKAWARVHDATVGEDGGGREIAGPLTGEESHDGANLSRLGHAPERDGGVQRLQLGGIGLGLRVDRCVNRSWPDADDGDTHRRQLDAGGA